MMCPTRQHTKSLTSGQVFLSSQNPGLTSLAGAAHQSTQKIFWNTTVSSSILVMYPQEGSLTIFKFTLRNYPEQDFQCLLHNSAPALWSDSHVVLARISDKIMGAGGCFGMT